MGNVYIPLLVFSMHKMKDKERNSIFFLGNVGFGYCCREDLKAVGYKLKQTIEIFKFVVMWKLQIYMSRNLDLKNTSFLHETTGEQYIIFGSESSTNDHSTI